MHDTLVESSHTVLTMKSVGGLLLGYGRNLTWEENYTTIYRAKQEQWTGEAGRLGRNNGQGGEAGGLGD